MVRGTNMTGEKKQTAQSTNIRAANRSVDVGSSGYGQNDG